MPDLVLIVTLNDQANHLYTAVAAAISSVAETAHKAVASIAAAAQIKVGDAVPDVTVKHNSPTEKLNFSKLQGKNVIVTLPAAFSPTCSETQAPSFIAKDEELSAKGVKTVYILSVNDIFAMKAWKKDLVSKAGIDSSKVEFGELALGLCSESINSDVE